jgi:hypothetical protein
MKNELWQRERQNDIYENLLQNTRMLLAASEREKDFWRTKLAEFKFKRDNEEGQITTIDKQKLDEFHAEIARELSSIKSLLKYRDEKTLDAVEERLNYCEEKLYSFRSE